MVEMLLKLVALISLFSFSACNNAGHLETIKGYFNDFSINPFEGTILNQFVNFRFRQRGDPVSFPVKSREYKMQIHEPLIFKYFDWVIWRFNRGHIQKNVPTPPRTVLLRPTEAKLSISFLSKLPELNDKEQRLLVIAGDDNRLSSVLEVLQHGLEIHYKKDRQKNITDFLTSRFSSIFYEAKNIPHEHIKTVPMGFTNFYVLQVSHGLITECMQSAAARNSSSKQLAFAAWGKVWRTFDDKIDDRKNLDQFLSLNSTQMWVSRQLLEFDEYWRTLVMYKYSLCPRGNGIQAPKVFEALILRVVPVVTRIAAYEDLVELGFPILIIDNWEQLSPEYLEREYQQKFLNMNWERVVRMITIDGVWKLLMNGVRYPF